MGKPKYYAYPTDGKRYVSISVGRKRFNLKGDPPWPISPTLVDHIKRNSRLNIAVCDNAETAAKRYDAIANPKPPADKSKPKTPKSGGNK